jgi:hypothetical protein
MELLTSEYILPLGDLVGYSILFFGMYVLFGDCLEVIDLQDQLAVINFKLLELKSILAPFN